MPSVLCPAPNYGGYDIMQHTCGSCAATPTGVFPPPAPEPAPAPVTAPIVAPERLGRPLALRTSSASGRIRSMSPSLGSICTRWLSGRRACGQQFLPYSLRSDGELSLLLLIKYVEVVD